MQEGVLDQMAELVEMLVVPPGLLTVFARRNNRFCTLCLDSRHDRITVVAFVGKKMRHLKAINQFVSLSAICSGTFCNNRSDRHTMRIHGQMYLCVEPPFVRLIP